MVTLKIINNNFSLMDFTCVSYDDHPDIYVNKAHEICCKNMSRCITCDKLLKEVNYEEYRDHHVEYHTSVNNEYMHYNILLRDFYFNKDIRRNQANFIKSMLCENIIDLNNMPKDTLCHTLIDCNSIDDPFLTILLENISIEKWSDCDIYEWLLESCYRMSNELTLMLINRFLDLGISINNVSGNKTIFLSCLSLLSIDLIDRLLTEFGCDIDETNIIDGNNAIQVLMIDFRYEKDIDVINEVSEVIAFLITRGISLNNVNRTGHTPIHFANYFCWVDVLDGLIEKTDYSDISSPEYFYNHKDVLRKTYIDIEDVININEPRDIMSETEYDMGYYLKLLFDDLHKIRYTKDVDIINETVKHVHECISYFWLFLSATGNSMIMRNIIYVLRGADYDEMFGFYYIEKIKKLIEQIVKLTS